MLFTYFPGNYSDTFLVPPAAAGEEQEKEARTPRAPAGGRSPPAPPAQTHYEDALHSRRGKSRKRGHLALRQGEEVPLHPFRKGNLAITNPSALTSLGG